MRDHNHDRQNYSSHCRYVFLPFVEDVIKEDASRDPIGIVSQFSIEGKYYFMNHFISLKIYSDKDDLNNDRRDLDFENLKKAHSFYLKMLQSGSHGRNGFIEKFSI